MTDEHAGSGDAAPLIEAEGVGVRFGATVALDGVDLDLRGGEVHAVVGENGAGKSTLLRVIAGALRPDSGYVRVRSGARVTWVPQDAALPPDLAAGDWIFLGQELHGRLGRLRTRAMRDEAERVLQAIGCRTDPGARLGELAASQRKQVQLARAFRGAVDALLLDEPTAVLGAAETEQLFAAIRRRTQAGAGVLYVSHRLDEVLGLADRVTVLRDGRRVSTDPVAAVDVPTLVRRMVGRDVPAPAPGGRDAGAVVLRVRDLAVGHVRGLSVDVRGSEIVGLAGLVGAGRSAVLEAVAGLRPVRAGRIECAAPPVFVPEDRVRNGLVPDLALRENLFLPAGGWRLRPRDERRAAGEWIARLGIRCRGSEAAIESLSGGNQQKLLLARALRHRPRLLLLDEPTAGVDVGAKSEIHAIIRQLAAAGAAIVLASSDLPELLHLCNRIVALYRGRVAGTVAGEDANEPRLAALITGSGDAPATEGLF